MTKDYPWGKGTPVWSRDAALNDSDKSYTVPVGKIWMPLWINFTLATSATVGNRIMSVNLLHDGTNATTIFTSGNVAASTTAQFLVGFGVFTQDDASNRLALGQSFPMTVLPSGAILRVFDQAVIDAAADDLTVVLHYIEYDA